MKKAVILYCSFTGNTEKAAKAIDAGLKEGGMETTLMKFQDAEGVDYFDYDLVCVGAPSYNWSVPQPANEFLKKKFAYYKSIGKIVPNSPRVGKEALMRVTSNPLCNVAFATVDPATVTGSITP